jgi:predicted MFS family arabinose efflux permease
MRLRSVDSFLFISRGKTIINVGIAIGSAMGGLVVIKIGLIHVSWVGGIFALGASSVTFISFRMNQKVQVKKSSV